MKPDTPTRLLRHPRPTRWLPLLAALLLPATSAHADRFIVPTDPSSGAASSASSSSSSSSPSPSSETYHPDNSTRERDRFITPLPSGQPSASGRDFQGYYDPFWGGCYYWGGDYYFWGGHYYSTHNRRFGMYRDFHDFDYRTVPSRDTQSPVFFPPVPPPLGTAVPPRPPSPTSISAPAELASHMYEPFYAPLSTRLAKSDLTKKQLQRLDAYRTSRSRLQAELLQRLDELKDAAPTARVDALRLLAEKQSPALAKLEAEADALRGDLLHGGLVGLLSGTGDWNQNRRWRLGADPDQPREQTLAAEFRVIRAAVFYQDGLSPEQRRLLREVEMELQIEAFRPRDKTPSDPDERLLAFSPEGARLPLAPGLPASLAVKIAAYDQEKSSLRTELRDALYTLDTAASGKRASTLRALAEKQAPSFNTLEALAEEIRDEYTRLPAPPGPPRPPAFPPSLSARITAYYQEKIALQKLLQAVLEDIKKNNTAAVRVVGETALTDTATFQLQVRKGENSAAVMASARKAIESFNREQEKRITSLNRESAAIRADVAAFAASQPAAAAKSVDTLINDFAASLEEGQRWQHYRYYQIAMLQPGISPAQRRLLFQAALERLNLPLPAGEYPP